MASNWSTGPAAEQGRQAAANDCSNLSLLSCKRSPVIVGEWQEGEQGMGLKQQG